MAFLLLRQQFREALHQRLEATKRLDLRHLFRRQKFFRQLAQPFFRQMARQYTFVSLQPLEALCEHPIEPIEVPLVLYQRRTAQIVEVVDAPLRHARLHRPEQRQVFGDRRWQPGLAQPLDQVCKH
jgi:hypothetical protein